MGHTPRLRLAQPAPTQRNRALRDVSPAVREAIRCGIAGFALHWPNKMDEPELFRQIEDALAAGHLVDNDVTIDLDARFGPVRPADKATRRLARELEGDGFDPAFFEWFK